MQINWQQVRRLLVIFVGDIETELTFLRTSLQKIRETSTNAEITLLLPRRQETEDRRQEAEFNFPLISPAPLALFSPTHHSPLTTHHFPIIDRIIPYTTTWQDPTREKELIENLRQFEFDAAIILTSNSESPYPFAYLAYLAGIPIRVGRSREFGGSVISCQLSAIGDRCRDVTCNVSTP